MTPESTVSLGTRLSKVRSPRIALGEKVYQTLKMFMSGKQGMYPVRRPNYCKHWVVSVQLQSAVVN